MVVKIESSTEKTEQSAELRSLDHDGFFTNTFQTERLARGFLRAILPGDLLECLDLNELTIESTHLTDDVFKDRYADLIYRVPVKETENHVDFFVILEHKSYNDL